MIFHKTPSSPEGVSFRNEPGNFLVSLDNQNPIPSPSIKERMEREGETRETHDDHPVETTTRPPALPIGLVPGSGPSTRAVHGGSRRTYAHHSLTAPIVQTATYTFEDTADLCDFMEARMWGGAQERSEYGRYGNPTVAEKPGSRRWTKPMMHCCFRPVWRR
jgi:hypothetical protein